MVTGFLYFYASLFFIITIMFNCIIRNTPLRPTTKNLLLFYLYTRIPKSKNKKAVSIS